MGACGEGVKHRRGLCYLEGFPAGSSLTLTPKLGFLLRGFSSFVLWLLLNFTSPWSDFLFLANVSFCHVFLPPPPCLSSRICQGPLDCARSCPSDCMEGRKAQQATGQQWGHVSQHQLAFPASSFRLGPSPWPTASQVGEWLEAWPSRGLHLETGRALPASLSRCTGALPPACRLEGPNRFLISSCFLSSSGPLVPGGKVTALSLTGDRSLRGDWTEPLIEREEEERHWWWGGRVGVEGIDQAKALRR